MRLCYLQGDFIKNTRQKRVKKSSFLSFFTHFGHLFLILVTSSAMISWKWHEKSPTFLSLFNSSNVICHDFMKMPRKNVTKNHRFLTLFLILVTSSAMISCFWRVFYICVTMFWTGVCELIPSYNTFSTKVHARKVIFGHHFHAFLTLFWSCAQHVIICKEHLLIKKMSFFHH